MASFTTKVILAAGVTFPLALGIASSAPAATVYSNGTPDLQNATLSDAVALWQTADDFVLTTETTLRSVRWWGTFTDWDINPTATNLNNFTLQIYTGNSSSPNLSPLYSFNLGKIRKIATGSLILSSYDLFEFQAGISPVALTAGTYWLSIINNSPDPNAVWWWATSRQTGRVVGRETASSPWSASKGEQAFEVATDAVPAPPTVLATVVAVAFGAAFKNCQKK
jgi:hypothetical protein